MQLCMSGFLNLYRAKLGSEVLWVCCYSGENETTKRFVNQVALLIMDTQGAFSCNATITDCTKIFTLSFLLSSIQIYNLSTDITERDLEHLQVWSPLSL